MEVTDTKQTRDKRFKYILDEQLGKKGLFFIVNQSFLFLLSLIIIVSIMIGVIGGSNDTTKSKRLRLRKPMVVRKATGHSKREHTPVE